VTHTLWLVEGARQYPVLSGTLDQCIDALSMVARTRRAQGWTTTVRNADRIVFVRNNQSAMYAIQRSESDGKK
jgi:hypothetical protein